MHRVSRYRKLHPVLPSQLSLLLYQSEGLGGGISFFQAEEVFFEFQSQPEAREAAVRSENPVAGDYDEKWIAAQRVTDTPVSCVLQSLSDGFVCSCFSVGNFPRFPPNSSLVRGSDDKIKRKGCEIFSLSFEISFEKLFFRRESLIVDLERNLFFFDGTLDLLERILVLYESGEAQTFIGFCQENFPFRDIQDGVKHG
ncbi:hypothetical protein ES703_51039 [subsurface metagenome]